MFICFLYGLSLLIILVILFLSKPFIILLYLCSGVDISNTSLIHSSSLHGLQSYLLNIFHLSMYSFEYSLSNINDISFWSIALTNNIAQPSFDNSNILTSPGTILLLISFNTFLARFSASLISPISANIPALFNFNSGESFNPTHLFNLLLISFSFLILRLNIISSYNNLE